MAMDDATWARHANPLSVWSRFSVLPLLVLAIWSRVWLGWWALPFVVAALAWNWINPRAFGPPQHLESWASRAVLGERIFLTYPAKVPRHHLRMAHLLTWASLPGLLILLWGLWALWWERAVFGTLLTALPKVWFVDRMVWILQDWQAAGHALPGMAGWENEHV